MHINKETDISLYYNSGTLGSDELVLSCDDAAPSDSTHGSNSKILWHEAWTSREDHQAQ